MGQGEVFTLKLTKPDGERFIFQCGDQDAGARAYLWTVKVTGEDSGPLHDICYRRAEEEAGILPGCDCTYCCQIRTYMNEWLRKRLPREG